MISFLFITFNHGKYALWNFLIKPANVWSYTSYISLPGDLLSPCKWKYKLLQKQKTILVIYSLVWTQKLETFQKTAAFSFAQTCSVNTRRFHYTSLVCDDIFVGCSLWRRRANLWKIFLSFWLSVKVKLSSFPRRSFVKDSNCFSFGRFCLLLCTVEKAVFS